MEYFSRPEVRRERRDWKAVISAVQKKHPERTYEQVCRMSLDLLDSIAPDEMERWKRSCDLWMNARGEDE